MYKAGYTYGVFQDSSRARWVDSSPRPIAWTCWYPVSIDEETSESSFGGSTEAPLFTQGQVAFDAEIVKTQSSWPLVLLSHGTGGTATGMSWLGARLARMGYVCVGVDHHGNTANEAYRAEGFICWWERVADLSFILDHVDQIQNIGAHIDGSNVAVAGFSLGGYTALSMVGAITSMGLFETWRIASPHVTAGPREFPNLDQEIPKLMEKSDRFRASWERQGESYLDRRVKRCIAIAPAPPIRAFTAESLEEIKCPILVISGEADTEAPFNECSVWLSQQNAGIELHSAGKTVGHYTFLAECTNAGKSSEPDLCIDCAGVDRSIVHDAVTLNIERFLTSSSP